MYLCRQIHANGIQSDGRWWSLRAVLLQCSKWVKKKRNSSDRKRKSHPMKMRKLMWHSIKSEWFVSRFRFFSLSIFARVRTFLLFKNRVIKSPSFSHLYLLARSHTVSCVNMLYFWPIDWMMMDRICILKWYDFSKLHRTKKHHSK